MNGPRYFRRTGPVPVTLAGLPGFDPSRPGIPFPYTQDPGQVFESPPPAHRQIVDNRAPNLNNFVNFQVIPSATFPVLQANYYRSYLLFQNLDAAGTIGVSFNIQPNLNSALQLPPGIGFIWDSLVPFSAVYVFTISAITVNPIGIEGSVVSPLSVPQPGT